MSFFKSLFGKRKKEEKVTDEVSNEKHIQLQTEDLTIDDPTVEDIESVIDEFESFVSLAIYNHNLPIEVVQCSVDQDYFVFEALPPDDAKDSGTIYYLKGITRDEVFGRFKAFLENQTVDGYKHFETKHM